jgi:diacylglycerol O-acyltransferase
MDRMSALDAEFLHLEDGVNHMHIGACTVFEGPPPAPEQLADLVRRALPSIPRYRQRVQELPLQLGRPVWVDDTAFDLHDHLRHATLQAPGGDGELQALTAEVMSTELDRTHPLWEMWVVDGVAGGRWAIISKVHHCMVDGVAGVGLLQVLLDVEPTPPPRPAADPWAPSPPPTDTQLLVDAAAQFGSNLAGAAGRAVGSLARPRAAAANLRELGQGVGSWAGILRPTPKTSIDGPITSARTWTWARRPLQDAKDIRAALGGTVNDVILAAVTRGFRDVLLAREEDPGEVVVRCGVPVSVRTDAAALDNEVVAMVAELPVGVSDPHQSYAAVRAEMDRLKATHEVEAGEAGASLADLVAPPLLAWGTKGMVAVLRRTGQRAISTVATNVPGPQQPLYADGRRMVGYYPYVPVALGVRLAVAIVSYDGGLFFGITGDRHTAEDLAVLARGVEAAIDELRSGRAS